MRLTLFDGSNYLRRKYEETRTISGLRESLRDVRTEIARPNNRPIFVWDGFRGNDYRKAFYPLYKGQRTGAEDAFYVQIDIFKEILKHLNICVVNVPGYEADDIIGYIAKNAKGKVDGIHIKSTDKDFEQLEGTTHEGKTLELPSNLIIPYKILVGDKSDNIKGIVGFGPKSWGKLNLQQVVKWTESDFDPSLIPDGFTANMAKYCQENVTELQTLKKVCEFRDVPDELVTKHMHFGTDNPAEVERILKENLA